MDNPLVPTRAREDVQAVNAEALSTDAARFQIATDDDYERAAEFLKRIKSAQQRLAELKDSIVLPLNTALRNARELFRKPEWLAAEAEQSIKLKMIAHDDAKDQARRDAQAALDLAALDEREALAARAREAAQAGDVDRAAIIEDQARSIVSTVLQPDAMKIDGIVYRDTWSAEVIDLRALVRAVANGAAPLASLEANTKFLNQQARSLRAELNYPGVIAKRQRGIAAQGSG